jgi:hypothetical protein
MGYDVDTIIALFEDFSDDDPIDMLERFEREHKKDGWQFACGETRCVVYHKTWDFVIKVDRNYDTQFYCAAEVRNYQKAEQYRVQQVLLPISKMCEVNGWKLYRQTRFDCQYASRSYRGGKFQRECEQVKRNRYTISHFAQSLDRLDTNWLARVVQLYGKKFAHSLGEWAKECEVCDLHRNNIGFAKGRPIILDFAGYFEGYDCLPSWASEVAENF